VANPNVQQGWSGMARLFSQYTIKTEKENHAYRPLTALSFALEVAILGGVTPFRAHMVNLVLYFAICVLLFKVLCKLFPSGHKWTALFTVLIFLIHPIHTETIYNIKCRDELMACLGGLWAFRFALQFADQQRKRDIALCFSLLLGALLCKPTAIPFLVLIPLSLWYFKSISLRRFLMILMPILAFPFLLGKVINKKLIKEESHREFFYQENPLYVGDVSMLDRIPLATYTMAKYVGLHVFPFPLSSYYGYSELRIMTWKDWQVWISALVLMILILGAFLSYRSKPILAFGLFWFLGLLLIYSNFIRPAPGMFAERFVFVASIGFSIVLGYAGSYLIRLQTTFLKTVKGNRLAATLILMVLASCITWNTIRAGHWKNELTLLRRDVESAPKSAKMHAMLANVLFRKIPNTGNMQERKREIDEAIMHYSKAVGIYDGYAIAWNNLATMLVGYRNDREGAISAYSKAIERDPAYAMAYFGLGYVYEKENAIDKARKFYQEALRCDPDYEQAQIRLALLN